MIIQSRIILIHRLVSCMNILQSWINPLSCLVNQFDLWILCHYSTVRAILTVNPSIVSWLFITLLKWVFRMRLRTWRWRTTYNLFHFRSDNLYIISQLWSTCTTRSLLASCSLSLYLQVGCCVPCNLRLGSGFWRLTFNFQFRQILNYKVNSSLLLWPGSWISLNPWVLLKIMEPGLSLEQWGIWICFYFKRISNSNSSLSKFFSHQ